MQSTLSEIKDLQGTLTLVIEEADYKDAVEQELHKVRSKVQLPGFRTGMVPFSIVRKKYYGGVLAETLEKTIQKGLDDFSKEHKDMLLQPLANSELTPAVDLEATQFTFAFDVAFTPDCDLNYTQSNKLPYYRINLDDKALDEIIKDLCLRHATRQPVEDYQPKDVLRGELKELNVEDPHTFANGILDPEYFKEKGKHQAKLFANAKKGDKITFNPKKALVEDKEVRYLLGITDKESTAHLESDYEFTITDIIRAIPAKLDADFFAQIFPQAKPADEATFRQLLKNRYDESNTFNSDWKFVSDVREDIKKRVEKITLPDTFLKRYFQEKHTDKSVEEIEKDYPSFVEYVHWLIASDKLCQLYDIKVEVEDMKNYIRRDVGAYFLYYGLYEPINDLEGLVTERMNDKEHSNEDYYTTLWFKISEKLRSLCTIEEKVVSQKEFQELK